jgi:riboflavin kinase
MRMQVQILGCLLELASRGADKDFVRAPARDLGKALGRSQQTTSRLLLAMEADGLVERRKAGRDQLIKITSSGLEGLRGLHHSLSKIFEGHVVVGRLFTGLGEGAYYMSQEGYRRQFQQKLGFDPFPGTLNLRVKENIAEDLSNRSGAKIEGFDAGDRSFGGGRCFPARVGPYIQAAVFIPDRTHYPTDVLEIVSPEKIRQRMGLRDGDLVRVTVLPASD